MFGLDPSLSAKKALKLFQEKKIDKIIEIGAGLGRDTIFFAKNLIHTTALDYSSSGIKAINQKANIILTAYDATVYGKIKGKVSKIGVNTLEDPATGETYYPITILAEDKTFDQRPNEVAEFVPGMEASVELVGEKRSIAQYIMKPFKKFQLEAFTDR